ncbi:hypothetical protein E8E13_009232 [Curvularia kusanoi]|uniref:Uncharacterized protein n=1 Tax=Curvularia kusanoi TaxID=90978 RepID=A0A9P4WBQ8_CURKU|nr:hypothetical protein E8E13_009232 [Curvularia kusanoi]
MLERHWAQYGPLYMTSIQTSHQVFDQPRDLFGNVRIPDISTVIPSSNSQNRDQWHNISEQAVFNYTSLLGVPLVDVPQFGNTSFTLESPYWEVSCEKFVADETERLIIGPTGKSFFMDFDIDGQAVGSSEMHFDYVTKTNDGNETMPITNKQSKCLATLRLVESDVGCKAGDCKVQKMRYLDLDTSHMFHGNTTIDRDNWSYLFKYLTDFMPGADLGPDESGADTSSEIIELWMADPSGALGDPLKSPAYNFVNLGDLPTEIFNSRLQTAMNTFWDSTLSLAYRSGNMTTRDLEARNEADSAAWATTKAVGTIFDGEEYVCNNTFAALTIIISALLFVAASVSIVLGILTKAPDILGYVSTLGRDDPYFGQHIPSHFDGLEATRLLRDVRVIVGDVRREAP